jgi:hypothetical protein
MNYLSPINTNMVRLKLNFPLLNNGEIKRLVIESDENDSKGFFLYYYKSDNTAFDTWHKTLDDAFEAARVQYGVTKDKWEKIADE